MPDPLDEAHDPEVVTLGRQPTSLRPQKTPYVAPKHVVTTVLKDLRHRQKQTPALKVDGSAWTDLELDPEVDRGNRLWSRTWTDVKGEGGGGVVYAQEISWGGVPGHYPALVCLVPWPQAVDPLQAKTAAEHLYLFRVLICPVLPAPPQPSGPEYLPRSWAQDLHSLRLRCLRQAAVVACLWTPTVTCPRHWQGPQAQSQAVMEDDVLGPYSGTTDRLVSGRLPTAAPAAGTAWDLRPWSGPQQASTTTSLSGFGAPARFKSPTRRGRKQQPRP